jgi:hypothetical protein
MNFVVRIERDAQGAVRGVVERVRTGAKEPFRGIETIGALIGRMIETEAADIRRASRRRGRTPSPREGRARQ